MYIYIVLSTYMYCTCTSVVLVTTFLVRVIVSLYSLSNF